MAWLGMLTSSLSSSLAFSSDLFLFCVLSSLLLGLDTLPLLSNLNQQTIYLRL